MRIIINELKKLFSIKGIVLLLLITGIMYKLYIIPVEEMRDSHRFINQIHKQMVEKYGTSMDEKEYEDFIKKYEEKVRIADDYIKNNKDFSELGVYDYKEYNRITRNDGEEKYQNPKLQDLYYEYYYYKDEITVFRELGEMENIRITYEGNVFEPFEALYSKNEKVINRHIEIIEGKEIQSLLPYSIFENYESQFKYLMVLILISIIFIVSPVYLEDKLNKTNYIQYSSKYGRNIFKSKALASVISSLIITTTHMIIFFSIYLNKMTKTFLDCGISGYYNSPIKSWHDVNFEQYIIITVVLGYLLSIVISLISMYVSSKCNKYISLIGIQVLILFIVFQFLLKYIINNATSMYIQISGLNYLTTPKYFLPIVYALLISTTSMIIIKKYKREKKTNIN